jgi:multiple sugar transport system permease protein
MKRFNRNISEGVTAYAFLSPAILILIFIFGYQIVRLFWFSLVHWQGYRYTTQFNNFKYFATIFSRGYVVAPLLRSFLIIAIVIPAVIFLTVFISHHLYRKIVGYRFYRWLFFLTSIIPVVVASIIWTYLLNLYGPVNNLLRALHLDFLVVDWFGNSKSAIFALCWIIVWREIGFSTIIFLAELGNASTSVYEAALMDGANEFQLMRFITFPYLHRIMKLFTVTMTIFVLNNLFGVVLVSTNGGPGYATTVLEYYIYFLTFRAGKIGMGLSVAVLLFIITMVLVVVYVRSFSRRRGEGVF